MRLNRRKFLQVSAGVATAMALTSKRVGAQLKPVVKVGNPLESYPDRRWEEVYRDQYKYERSFTYCCSPNDTHQCRVRGFVRNGILMRIEQNYDHHKIRDLYGNQADAAWNPRMCLRGMTYPRRAYGPYRNKYPMIRVGWKQWADDGFPYLDKENREKYKMTSRGTDEFVRMTWDQTFTYLAKGHVAVAKAYSGARGAQRLKNEGYQPEMIEAMSGSGPRTFKYRGGMGLLGVLAHRVAEEVGIGIGQLLVGDLDHVSARECPRMGEVGLCEHCRTARVHLHSLPENLRIEGGDIVRFEDCRRVDEATPVVEPRGEFAGQCSGGAVLGEVRLHRFGGREFVGQRSGFVARRPVVDHHMPARIGKGTRERCADPLSASGNENGWFVGHRRALRMDESLTDDRPQVFAQCVTRRDACGEYRAQAGRTRGAGWRVRPVHRAPAWMPHRRDGRPA